MRYLTTPEYDALLLAGLQRMGLDSQSARRLLSARWPSFGMALLIEAQGRGLIITMEDVQEFLADIHQDAPVPDAQAALFSPMAFDGLLAWCVATDRAQPTIVGELMQEQPETLEFMLQSSRAGSN